MKLREESIMSSEKIKNIFYETMKEIENQIEKNGNSKEIRIRGQEYCFSSA